VKVGTGQTEVKLQPGQFIFGRKAASKDLHIPQSTVWKRMLKLENMQNLNIQRNSKYSIINIINWNFYQGNEEISDSQEDKQGTGREQVGNTDNNVKNVENDKYFYVENSDEFRLASLLLARILDRRNSFKRPNLQTWAKHIDYMIRLDGRDPEEIERVVRWSQLDPFWQCNILSTKKLREQYDQLALKMGKAKKKGEEDGFSKKHYEGTPREQIEWLDW
jgi:DNA-binding Lrp family transcriptional regulator